MTARIYKPAQTAMQSGPGSEKWVLEFKPASARKIDPLMGWTSSSDMMSQVRLEFATKEEALEYAKRHGIAAIVEEPPAEARTVRPMGYAQNFAYKRKVPWSH